MGMTWGSNSDGSNNEIPLSRRAKVALFAAGFALFVILAAVATDKYSTGDEREVWWTQPCPTQQDPHRVCLDGTVSLDQVPEWAGGYAAE